MIYLNFTHLDTKTQERLLSSSKEDVESRSGTELRQFAQAHDKAYEALLDANQAYWIWVSVLIGSPCIFNIKT